MKASLRTSMLATRMALSAPIVQDYSARLVQKIRQLSTYQKANVVGLYMPIKNEPDLTGLLTDNKIFLLPQVVGQKLRYLRYLGEHHLKRSALGILEPVGPDSNIPTLDLIFIPALALDHQGNRLGFGKGFFDRFLAEQKPKKVVGVIYPFQLVSHLPTNAHDIAVDEILVAD